jgi:hypothetical protein
VNGRLHLRRYSSRGDCSRVVCLPRRSSLWLLPAPGVWYSQSMPQNSAGKRGKCPALPRRANGDRALMRIGVDYTRAKSSFFGASAGPQTDSSALGRSQPSRWSMCHCRLSILRTGFSGRMAKAIVGLPRISCRPCWRWRTPCGFPLMKAAHADVGGAPWQEIRVAQLFRPMYAWANIEGTRPENKALTSALATNSTWLLPQPERSQVYR